MCTFLKHHISKPVKLNNFIAIFTNSLKITNANTLPIINKYINKLKLINIS